ncbi:radical SAM protein [Candidatus Woesearchaeota archaeon]|nr:radical SAM protein [Candidatus Woesearchaeota archaeon]
MQLINPFPDKPTQHYWDRYPTPSLGYLSQFLESKKIPTQIIDMRFERLKLVNVLERINSNVIGITGMTHQLPLLQNIAQTIKQKYPSTKIIIGGSHATAYPKETLEQYNEFDYLIYGEGEQTLFEFFTKDIDSIDGLVYRDSSSVVVNKPRALANDIDIFPFPKWQGLPKSSKYSIFTSRGCPYQCNFCVPTHDKKVKFRSAESVIEEMTYLKENYNPKEIEIGDDTFTINRKRLDTILEGLIPLKMKWKARGRVDTVDYELLSKMKKAGCFAIEYGVESGNSEILENSGKGITKEQVINAVALTKKAGIHINLNFILGHPYETITTAKETIDFGVGLNPTRMNVGIMVPYPQTKIREMALKGEGGYKKLPSDLSWDNLDKYLGSGLELENLDRKTLEKLQVEAYIRFYSQNFKVIEGSKFFLSHAIGIFNVIGNLLRRR